MSSYDKRGVSASKTDVHNAIKNLDKGLFPNAFCKIIPDILTNDQDYCNIMHADTAGTKTSLAYLYWKETGDLSIWKGISQDAIVMNLDDMACSGAVNNIVLSSTIGRNKHLIPGEVIKALIDGTSEFIDKMNSIGIQIQLAGGETADVGDIVRTADVGFTAFARLKRKDVLEIDIQEGDVIIGFESCGQSNYEQEYNSGIGSNGLTFARHEVLSSEYKDKYKETYAPETDTKYIYSGSKLLTDLEPATQINYGKLLLSPTRTFLPVIKQILALDRSRLHGIVHNTGGGYSKVSHFNHHFKIIKDNILPVPPIFQAIQKETGTDWKEMFQVFNSGCRLEVYAHPSLAEQIIQIGQSFNIHAQIIGRVEKDDRPSIVVDFDGQSYEY